MSKLFVVTVNGYYNEEYWDVYTDVIGVYSTKDKAIEAIYDYSLELHNEKPRYDESEDLWDIGNEEECYGYRSFLIEEVELDVFGWKEHLCLKE